MRSPLAAGKSWFEKLCGVSVRRATNPSDGIRRSSMQMDYCITRAKSSRAAQRPGSLVVTDWLEKAFLCKHGTPLGKPLLPARC
jgi:hypothetical protein